MHVDGTHFSTAINFWEWFRGIDIIRPEWNSEIAKGKCEASKEEIPGEDGITHMMTMMTPMIWWNKCISNSVSMFTATNNHRSLRTLDYQSDIWWFIKLNQVGFKIIQSYFALMITYYYTRNAAAHRHTDPFLMCAVGWMGSHSMGIVNDSLSVRLSVHGMSWWVSERVSVHMPM